MVDTAVQKLSKSEFWALAAMAQDVTYELLDGVAVPKMSPKYLHARTVRRILMAMVDWVTPRGRVEMEWAFELNESSTPFPDLIYVSFDRLPATWEQNEACPVAPELAVEVISPGQTFGQMAQKASWYLAGGVLRVWVVDTEAQSIAVFCPAAAPVTYCGDQVIGDELFPGLSIKVSNLLLKSPHKLKEQEYVNH